MESTEALHRHTENVEDLQQIVRTMKALSAVSIRQCERAARSRAEYEHTIDPGLQAVLQGRNKLVASRCRGPSSAGKVVFGSDHGRRGHFNEMIAEDALREGDGRSGADRLLAVGERVAAAPERENEGGLQILPVLASATAITSLVQRVLLQVDGWRQR